MLIAYRISNVPCAISDLTSCLTALGPVALVHQALGQTSYCACHSADAMLSAFTSMMIPADDDDDDEGGGDGDGDSDGDGDDDSHSDGDVDGDGDGNGNGTRFSAVADTLFNRHE